MSVALFDLDGTVIDSQRDIALSVNLMRADFGLAPLPLASVLACVGEGTRALIERAAPEKPECWDAMGVRHREHYVAHCLDATALYPGVRETVAALRAAGWRTAVVTNKPGAVTRRILEGLDALALFDAVVGGGDAAALKPDPAPLHEAARRMGVVLAAGDWMVGDHYTDLEAGRRAGLRRCFCRYGIGETRGEAYDLAIGRMEDFLDAVL